MSGEPQTEIVFDSGFTADLTSARQVLAFVLTPPAAFFSPKDTPEEQQACIELLFAAKTEAIQRWMSARRAR